MLLEVRAIEAGYGTSQVLFGPSLAVAEGEIATLLGRNGMGKTTTVRCLSGLLKPTSGEIRFKGARIDGAPPHAIAHAGLGLVPEGRHIFANLTVRENLVMAAIRRPGRREARISRAETPPRPLRRCRPWRRLQHSPQTYSLRSSRQPTG